MLYTDFVVIAYLMISVGGLSLIVRGILCIELYAVYKNFGKGLRERGDTQLQLSGL